MATHDRPEMLRLGIGHFLRQRGVHAELIVVDDSVVPCRIPDLPGVRLLRVDRGMPLGSKLNAAAEQARGHVLAKWDDDDYYGSGYLATMAAFLRRTEAKVVFVQPFLCYDLITGTLRVSDEHRCSGATLTMARHSWAATPFPQVREAVDATFLLDVVTATGPESCAGLDVGGEFIQVRHGGHLWTHMPDGQPVSDYLTGCAVSELRLGEVVDRRTIEGWARRREELMADGQRVGHSVRDRDRLAESGQGFSGGAEAQGH
jgi:O-antigen biosynthesis protein